MQLLWINIVTDVLPGIGLDVDAADPPRALREGPPPSHLLILGDVYLTKDQRLAVRCLPSQTVLTASAGHFASAAISSPPNLTGY